MSKLTFHVLHGPQLITAGVGFSGRSGLFLASILDYQGPRPLRPFSHHSPPPLTSPPKTAMATVCIQADVFEVQPLGHLTGKSSTDPVATVFRLFQDGSESSGTEERPQKKRKLDNGKSIELKPAEPFDGSKSALLAGISIDLVGVPTSTSLCCPCTDAFIARSCTFCGPEATRYPGWSSQCVRVISGIV